MRSIYSPQRRRERKGLIIFLFSGEKERPENKKNQLYKVNLIARATMFVAYLKLNYFPKKHLRGLCASAVIIIYPTIK